MSPRPLLHRRTAWRWLAVAAAGAAATALIADRLADSAGSGASPGRAAAPAARYGPGLWTAPAASAPPVRADTEPPGGLSIDAGGNLVPDRALRFVFDYFLLGGQSDDLQANVQRLRAHLLAALPPRAGEQASRIAQDYLAYLSRHDALTDSTGAQALRAARDAGLAATADARLDIDGMERWMAQRNRLRQETLGVAVTRAFFADDDAAMQTLIEAERRRRAGLAVEDVRDTATPASALAAYGRMADDNVPLAERQAHFAEHFGQQASNRLAALEAREEQWQQRYARYRAEAGAIAAQAGTVQVDKQKQLAALLASRFPQEHERLRAAALDAEPAWPPAAGK